MIVTICGADGMIYTPTSCRSRRFCCVGIVERKAASHESVGIVEGDTHRVEDAFAVDEDFHVVGFENAVIVAGAAS